jgi:RNA-binding protein NOB1
MTESGQAVEAIDAPRGEEQPLQPVELEARKKKIVVVDTGAIIKGFRLEKFSTDLWTINEVLHEVRDRQSREFLASFPYKIQTREPSNDAIKHVIEFAKKTGDFSSLSATDIRVLALTYLFEFELNGNNHLRSEPVATNLLKQKSASTQSVSKPQDAQQENVQTETPQPPATDTETQTKTLQPQPDPSVTTVEQEPSLPLPTERQSSLKTPGTGTALDGDGDWITPDNVQEYTMKQHASFLASPTEAKSPAHFVGCVTTDFAMQNVMLQMGLNVLSVDGLLLKRIRQWMQKCRACFKATSDMTKLFCEKCGNHTLYKVEVIIDSRGDVHFRDKYKDFNLKGSRYSLPLPKGGRQSKDPILTEDQLFASYLKPRKHRGDQDGFSANFSFALAKKAPSVSKDVIVGHPKKNPNIPRHLTGKKKKHPF